MSTEQGVPVETPVPRVARREVASIGKNPFFPSFDGSLRPDDDTLATRGGQQGLRIYQDVARDCHVRAVIEKRKMAVVKYPWGVEPASEAAADVEAADLVREFLQALNFDNLTLGMLDALMMGFSVGEVMWDTEGGRTRPIEVRMRDQRRFNFVKPETGRSPWGVNLHLRTPQNMHPGEEVPARKFIWHTCGSKDGNPYGLGLGSSIFWPTFFKRQGLSFWLIFAEKFGSPTAKATVRPGASPEEVNQILEAMSRIAQDSGIVVPEGTTLEFLEALRSAGSMDTYEHLVRYCDEEISKAVLGETLTTAMSQTGAYAASKTHNDVRLELCQADADLLSDTLNKTLVQWIIDLNMPGANPPRVSRLVSQPVDLFQMAQRDQIIVSMGFKPTLEYIHETYGDGFEEAPEPPPMPAPGQDGKPPKDFAEPVRDTADEIVDHAMPAAARALDVILDPVKKAVMDAKSLPDLRNKLDALYPKLDSDSFAELMTRALTVAALSGRWEVLDGR